MRTKCQAGMIYARLSTTTDLLVPGGGDLLPHPLADDRADQACLRWALTAHTSNASFDIHSRELLVSKVLHFLSMSSLSELSLPRISCSSCSLKKLGTAFSPQTECQSAQH